LAQATLQKASYLWQRNLLIVEGGKWIEQQVWLGQGGSTFQQSQYLVTGESPLNEDPSGCSSWVWEAQAQEAQKPVDRQTIASIQDGYRAAQGQFDYHLGDRFAIGSGSAKNGQATWEGNR
jgi:hypothetical protein